MTAQTKDERSEEQARAQLESIREMVAKLTIEGAATSYAAELSRAQCVELLADDAVSGIGLEDEDTLEELQERVAELITDGTIEPDGFEFDEDEARQRIEEDALSVEVRSDWHTPGSSDEDRKPAQFCILLCTGGPACRIMGELDENLEPHRAWLEHQDWGTPWTQYYEPGIQETLLAYARVFYFGE